MIHLRRKMQHWVIIVLTFLCFAIDANAQIKIVDGDSLEIDGERIRIDGIDAPEFLQVCQNEKGQDYSCGQEAMRYLDKLINGREVRCECEPQKDKYGRKLCECFVGEISLNREMVRAGWAMPYRDNDKYHEELIFAQKQKSGIWQGKNMRPAIYRILSRQEQKIK